MHKTIRSETDHRTLLSAIETHGSIRAAGVALGMPQSTTQKYAGLARVWAAEQAAIAEISVTDEARAKPEKPLVGGSLAAPESREITRHGRRFILTSVQNNTHPHHDLLASMQTWCKANRGELLAAPFSYNANAFGQGHENVVDGEGVYYDPALEPYLVRQPVRLAHDLIFCADLNISPSAVDPLSGLESYSKASSGVFPHTKQDLRSMASMKGTPARKLFTTGCLTMANYIPRKAGMKAQFHHIYGGLIVEIDTDGVWFIRQINCDDTGCFQDLDRVYTPDGVHEGTIEAFNAGDFHAEKQTDLDVRNAMFAPGGMIDVLQPRYQFVNDLADFAPRNHHNIKSPFFLARQRAISQESVEYGMQQCADLLRMMERPWSDIIVVESNHDQAFGRWLEEADGHRDPPNARYWHTWNARIFEAIEIGQDLFAFEAAVREKAPNLQNVQFLREDDSFVICHDHGGIECGLHGHRGPNGSRGSPKGYRVLGVRTNTGHTHSASIHGGQYCAGVTGDEDMGYNKGPSSWSRSHILTYPNGKRTIVTMHGPRWRGEPLPIEKPRYRVKASSHQQVAA